MNENDGATDRPKGFGQLRRPGHDFNRRPRGGGHGDDATLQVYHDERRAPRVELQFHVMPPRSIVQVRSYILWQPPTPVPAHRPNSVEFVHMFHTSTCANGERTTAVFATLCRTRAGSLGSHARRDG